MSSSSGYLGDVAEYLTGNGWETSQKQVREGVFLVLGTKQGKRDEKRLLAMVVTAAEGSVTTDHLKYLVKTGREQKADTVVITAEFGVDAQIEQIAKNHGISTISPSLVTSSDSGAGVTDSSGGSSGSTSWTGSESTSRSEAPAENEGEDESDTGGLLTRRRLVIGGGVGAVGLMLLGGGGSDSDSTNNDDSDGGGGPNGQNGYDVASVKSNAEEVPYEELFRNIEEYTGTRVFYGAAKIIQVVEQNSEKYQFRLNVTQNGQIWEDDVLGRWKGERFLEDDLVEFWGVVNGAFQYETVAGNQRTIPDFDIVDMATIKEPSVSAGNVVIVDDELNVEEGEFSDEITVVGTLQNNSRLTIGYVEATAQLLDANGDEVASNYMNTTEIAAGDSWEFEIPFYGEAEADNVDTYEVSVGEIS